MTTRKDEETPANSSCDKQDGKIPKTMRLELRELFEREAFLRDENRPEAVAKRREKHLRTARTNINDLCDQGSFMEYGSLSVAAQRGRLSEADLIRKTPADGLIAGIGSVNGAFFNAQQSRCMVLAYDYTVLAGTQGYFNHKKMDRMLKLADEQRLPVVLFAEGGGGRPGDVDAIGVMTAGLDLSTFSFFAKLSGKVPLIGIVAGPCFAGNAALLGCCDVIIATQNSNIGMGGPIMIEGGGLGVFKTEAIGPMDVQTENGVVDIEVRDDAQAVAVAKKYLAFFQGDLPAAKASDQSRLRDLIPENRRRAYDIRKVIKTLADEDSFLELRPKFGRNMVTGLLRIEGRPFGLIANNCMHMAGAIDADGADKAVHLMQICQAHGLPIVSLCDTPGFMVGPEIEKRAQVRHVCRMFVIGAHLTVPYFTIVLRRGYGLGAMAMAKGGFHESFLTASWPTGEFGAMGIEGAIKAGFKKELAAIEDATQREKLYEDLVDQLYQRGKAVHIASYLEIDAVIDPAETRHWIMRGLKSVVPKKETPENRYIDPW
jgi:acetyl-CoA carboxylase carboxyltransferase component